MICVSKCLMGHNCRYDGKNMRNDAIIEFLKDKEYVEVCPECLGGLSTPRDPSEIINDKVYSNKGKDVTEEFYKGAYEALKIAKSNQCKCAILQENSPSCGVNFVYDGTFSGKKIKGQGITTQVFIENGLEVYSSQNFLEENKEKLETRIEIG